MLNMYVRAGFSSQFTMFRTDSFEFTNPCMCSSQFEHSFSSYDWSGTMASSFCLWTNSAFTRFIFKGERTWP